MTSRTVSSLAFAAGVALALGAMPSAHAQIYAPTYAAPPAPQPYMPPQPSYGAASAHSMSSPSPPELAAGAAPAFGAPGFRAPPSVPPQVMATAPQASPGDFGGWSARRNNIESARYTRMLQTNMGFRQARMRKECGPINDPQLHQQCLASFDFYSPVMVGSSPPPRRMQHRGAGY